MGVIESLFVCDDVRMAYGGKKSDLVDSGLYFLNGQILEFDFFQCIKAVIFDAFDFVDSGVSAFPYSTDHLEIIHRHPYFIIVCLNILIVKD